MAEATSTQQDIQDRVDPAAPAPALLGRTAPPPSGLPRLAAAHLGGIPAGGISIFVIRHRYLPVSPPAGFAGDGSGWEKSPPHPEFFCAARPPLGTAAHRMVSKRGDKYVLQQRKQQLLLPVAHHHRGADLLLLRQRKRPGRRQLRLWLRLRQRQLRQRLLLSPVGKWDGASIFSASGWDSPYPSRGSARRSTSWRMSSTVRGAIPLRTVDHGPAQVPGDLAGALPAAADRPRPARGCPRGAGGLLPAAEHLLRHLRGQVQIEHQIRLRQAHAGDIPDQTASPGTPAAHPPAAWRPGGRRWRWCTGWPPRCRPPHRTGPSPPCRRQTGPRRTAPRRRRRSRPRGGCPGPRGDRGWQAAEGLPYRGKSISRYAMSPLGQGLAQQLCLGGLAGTVGALQIRSVFHSVFLLLPTWTRNSGSFIMRPMRFGSLTQAVEPLQPIRTSISGPAPPRRRTRPGCRPGRTSGGRRWRGRSPPSTAPAWGPPGRRTPRPRRCGPDVLHHRAVLFEIAVMGAGDPQPGMGRPSAFAAASSATPGLAPSR